MLELEDSLTFGMVLVQGRGDLLPLLELVLDGHHEAVEDGAGKQATSNEKEQQSTNKRTIKKNCSVNPTTARDADFFPIWWEGETGKRSYRFPSFFSN